MRGKRIVLSLLVLFCMSLTTNQWILKEKKDGVVFYITNEREESSSDIVRYYKVVKLENTLNEPVRVSWRLEKFYNGECSSCRKTAENFFSVLVAPNSEMEGFGKNKSSGLKVFSEFENGFPSNTKLTDLRIVDIEVKQVSK